MNPRGLALFMCLLLCSCTTEPPVHSKLPATVALNPDAGRGGLLIVEVRLPNGKKVPLALDTGSPITAFEASLAPQLGKCLDTGTLVNFGVAQQAGLYAVSALYLGKVPLQMTGSNVVTFDRHKLADTGWSPFMGFLGMDVLQHYCLQLDFTAGTLRFLADHAADPTHWGTPFPLTDLGDGCYTIEDNLAGATGQRSVVDTGCDSSGWLQPALYQQWTNQAAAADVKIHSPDGTLGGEHYHDLHFRVLDAQSPTNDDHIKFNGVGLRALAQNVVTLDFPHRTMYLLHTNDWPLATRDTEATMKWAGESTMRALQHLLRSNQLPGAAKGSHGKTTAFHFTHDDSPYRDTATWDLQKNDDTATYHYTFTRTATRLPWKLHKAWRTDPNGHTLEEYPVPGMEK